MRNLHIRERLAASDAKRSWWRQMIADVVLFFPARLIPNPLFKVMIRWWEQEYIGRSTPELDSFLAHVASLQDNLGQNSGPTFPVS